MIKVKIIATGDVKEVTPNIAHGMIERGEAEIVAHSKSEAKRIGYQTRQMSSTGTRERKATATGTRKKRGSYRTK